MFSFADGKTIEQLSKNPTAILGKMMEFHRSSIAAVGEIFENGNKALIKIASLRDPQALMTAPTILQEVTQQNLAVLTRVGQGWQEEIRAVTKEPTAKAA